jgi:hypothetical protein
MTIRSIAIIGSFRKERYGGVQDVIRTFRDAGFQIVSPSGAEIVSGEEFVRFSTDEKTASDPEVQTRTLERIFTANAVFVVAPGGYLGRTTCYEIGRIIQRRQAVYFSERPVDLPVHIPEWCVVAPMDFVLRFKDGTPFDWLFSTGSGELFNVERRLAST